MNKVQSYIEASKALREAYDELKYGKLTRTKHLAETFQPIVKPLETLSKELGKTTDDPPKIKTEKEEVENVIGETALKYLTYYSDKDVKTDKIFGFHTRNKEMFIGSEPVTIRNNDIYFPDGKKYKGTEGLWSLLTLQKPSNFSDEDVDNFEEIILKTDSYRRNNDPNDDYIKRSSGYKYTNFIKPILEKHDIIQTKKKGKGLKKIVTNNPVEYVYWNSLDELLEKLYIAYGEIKAGNKNPLLYNEITSILEEIREI